MTEVPEGRSAIALDVDVRRQLAMLLTGVHCGTDDQVIALARMETHRLVSAVIAGLRSHALDAGGACVRCGGEFCVLRGEISNSRLPIRRLPARGG